MATPIYARLALHGVGEIKYSETVESVVDRNLVCSIECSRFTY